MNVLVVARSAVTARQWAAMLDGREFCVRLAGSGDSDDLAPDVVVTDRHVADREDARGVVRIGTSGGRQETPGVADVCLPEDFAPRELRLACRLLGEIVRLRRRQHTRAELARRLAREALTDPLTSLPNRRAWEDALAERVRTARTTARWLCVAILDLDHFKRVNDNHGHPAGDEVLRAVARALGDGLRQDDFVARLGGDEFGLLLWVSDAPAAATVVDRVRQALPAAASAGYHVAPPRPQAGEGPGPDATEQHDPAVLVAAADQALRTAKQQGRGRTVGG